MTHIEQRVDTPANWTAANPILNNGEFGWERQGAVVGKGKIGDGVTVWNALPYFISSAQPATVLSVAGRTGTVVLAVADVAGAAPITSPAFLGLPTAPTQAGADSSTRIATTAHVKNALNTSPALGGTPTAPTQSVPANGTSIATTGFVKDVLAGSPSLGGSPVATTPASTDNSTRVATTAYVRSQRLRVLGRYANYQSAIPFGGFPANGTRYEPVSWANLAIPAGTQYAEVHLTLDAIAASSGGAEIQYWLAFGSNLLAYADVQTTNQTNGGNIAVNMGANLSSVFEVTPGTTTLSAKLGGRVAAVVGYSSVSTYGSNIRVTYMGY